MEGPRELREGELDSLRELTEGVFRTGMIEQYPQLFNAENFENLAGLPGGLASASAMWG